MSFLSTLKEKFTKNKSNDAYVDGLKKSRATFANKLYKLSKDSSLINENYFENLEEILIEADIGVNLTVKVLEKLTSEAKKQNIKDPEILNDLLMDELFYSYLNSGDNSDCDLDFSKSKPLTLLVSGVNGVGKTTSIAKLAYRYKQLGKKVLLCAADTFRAGAVEQLNIWSKRISVDIVCGKENADPASVAYEAAKKAKAEDYDLLIIDTAGRLQNKTNLMDELAKISRVLGREIEGAPHESFLVIDATTGQNGVSQAKQFFEVSNLTGIIITKMDGTSKGGIVLAIKNELGIPVRFIGLGEGLEDLENFNLEKYLYGLCVAD